MGHDEDKNFNALDELNRISGGSDDIIIGNAPQKRKSKAVIVVAAIILLAIVIVVLVLVKNAPKSVVSKETSSKFMDFAKTYLGEGVDFSESYSPVKVYAVDDAIDSSDFAFFENAKEKFSSFADTINDDTDEKIKSLVEQYKLAFNFAYAYGTSILPTEDDIIAKYKKVGKAGTVDYIKSAYSKILEVNYNDSEIDTANEIAYYTAMTELYDLYIINGCMDRNNTGNSDCLASKIGQANVDAAVKAVSDTKNKRVKLEKYVGYSKSALWDLNKQMGGEKR